eukprot:gene3745-4664_t
MSYNINVNKIKLLPYRYPLPYQLPRISSKHGYKKNRLRSNASDADLFNLVMPKADTVGFKSVVGFLASISLVAIDLIFKYVVFNGRDRFIALTSNYFLQYFIFIVWTVILGFCSSLIIKKICYSAVGSGVPDLKSIFSGFWNPAVVAPPVLLWKTIGLLFSYGSGLSIGKEGPYIHISAILANTLLNIKPFKNIAPNETQRSQMLASCCALGVAATFGSPIGGVLFSIEVTGTYYLISNYWRAFFTATVGAVGIKILLSTPSNDLLESYRTNFSNVNLATVQILAFIITGVIQELFKKLTPYGEVIIVCAVTALVTFPLKFLRLDHASAVHSLFTATDEANSEELKVWTESLPFANGIIMACFLYILVKLVLTSVSITLPIPYGIYIPLFAIGAAVGRFVGEIMKLIFPSMKDIYPAGYAVVGAAALCGGATRTVSSAVIILELTNDLTYMVPVLLGVVLSCGIGNLINHSIYDCFLRNKGLPYLPFFSVKSDSLLARDVMKRDLSYVTHRTTLSNIQNVLSKVNDSAIPLVESEDNLTLLGTISRDTLEEVVAYHERLHSYSYSKSPLGSSSLNNLNNNNININSNSEMIISMSDSLNDESYNIEKSLLMSDDIEMKGFSDHSIQMELQNPWVVIDSSPFQIVESMPVRKIIFMFMMLGGNVLYATHKGKLVGTISKSDIVKKSNININK